MGTRVQKSAYSRLFIIENMAGPTSVPRYQGLAKAGALSWPQGDVTPIRVPSSDRYGEFDTIDQVRGDRGQPQVTISGRYGTDLSDLFRLAKGGCPVDLQIHMGLCQDPRDFNAGWDKILIIEEAYPTQYSTTDLGALEPGQNAMVDEEVPFTGTDAYEVKKLAAAELGQTEIVMEVVGVAICDRFTCGGACGTASSGCDRVFAIQKATTGSPGLPAELVYSANGGTTLSQTNVHTLPTNRDPSAILCVGSYLVVASQTDEAIHYALTQDIIDAVWTTTPWTKNGSGITTTKGPNALFSLGSGFTWGVGQGGYIYFWEDITAAAATQSSGGVTSQNLLAIHGIDTERLVAVGASNAVVYTTNGGTTWASITGPAVGISLNAVWMRSENVWFIGAANGNLYYTLNAGISWSSKAFSGSGSGSVRDIKFANRNVGYMAHSTATPGGRIFRTIDGGYSWKLAPVAAIPANDYVASLAACTDDPNVVFGGGLADNASDGFFVKLS